MQEQVVDTIFNAIDELKMFHQELYPRLRSASKLADIIGVLESSRTQFAIYLQYSKGIYKALKSYDDAYCSSPSVQKFMRKSFSNSNNGVVELLLQPLQRIASYHTLLLQLHKNVSVSPQEKARIAAFVSSLNDVLDSVRTVSQGVQMQAKVIGILHKFKDPTCVKSYGPLLSHNRALIHEGVLTTELGDSVSQRKFYLFTDLLLWVNTENDKFRGCAFVRNIHLSSHPTKGRCFQISKSQNKSIRFYCDRPNDMAVWEDLLTRLQSTSQ
mmetsp:Transcript_24428/g.48043  ORF Transcript_24428/g.48043 Transcript_24428/m.48043 type:complete len:270 (-) Transcript_24428:134-943(-)